MPWFGTELEVGGVTKVVGGAVAFEAAMALARSARKRASSSSASWKRLRFSMYLCVESAEVVYNLFLVVLVVFVFICDLFVVVLVLIFFAGFAGF